MSGHSKFNRFAGLILPAALAFCFLALWLAAAAAWHPADLHAVQAAAPQPDSMALAFGLPGSVFSAQRAEPLPASGEDLQILAQDRAGLILQFTPPPGQIVGEAGSGAACRYPVIQGYDQAVLPGGLRLPVRGSLLGIPQDGQPSLQVLSVEWQPLPGRYELCPGSHSQLDGAQPGMSIDRLEPLNSDHLPPVGMGESSSGLFALETSGRSATPGAGATQPASPVELGEPAFLRSRGVVPLRFFPYRYNPGTGELFFARRLQIEVRFGASFPDDSTLSSPDLLPVDPFDDLLKSSLLNAEAAQAWRRSLPAAPASVSLALPALSGVEAPEPFFKIIVDREGLYRLSYADLASAGIPVDAIDPRTLRLTSQGLETALWVSGQNDGRFDPGDALLFYGLPPGTKYSLKNVYLLSWGGEAGLRMQTQDGAPRGVLPVPASFPERVRIEQNLRYQMNLSSGPDHNHWYWDYLMSYGAPASKSFSVDLDVLQNIDPQAQTVTLSGLLVSFGALAQHHTRVYLNDHLVDEAFWAAGSEYLFTVKVPVAYLLDGNNTWRVELPLDGGVSQQMVMVDWFEIAYARRLQAVHERLNLTLPSAGSFQLEIAGFSASDLEVFRLDDSYEPVRILGAVLTPAPEGGFQLAFETDAVAGSRFLAQATTRRLSPRAVLPYRPADLLSSANGADYMVIAPSEFYTAAQRLASYRAGQGLRAQVVEVQDIYDRFSAGLVDPEAIHSFLAYAYAYWQPPAPAYVTLLGDGHYDFLDYLGTGEPNYVPPYLAEADPWVGEVPVDNRYACVSGDDNLPDLFIGRLPARSALQADLLVQKIIDYEAATPAQDWNQALLFVADNADTGGNFPASSDRVIAERLVSPYTAQRVYLGITHPDAAGARAAEIAAINQGRLIVNYTGHAALKTWAAEGLFRLDDVAALTNTGKLPLVVSMACVDGYFVKPGSSDPESSALAEGFLRAQSSGAAAAWAATGYGLATGHDYLQAGLYDALFTQDIDVLGQAVFQGKLNLFTATSYHHDLLDTFTLFGDPALRLNLLPAELSVSQSVQPSGWLQPGDPLTYTLTFHNAGPAVAHQVRLEHLLPPALVDLAWQASGVDLTALENENQAWRVDDLAPGQTGRVTVTARVDPGFMGVFSTTARIATSARELDVENNTAGPLPVEVRAPNLTLAKSAPAGVPAGDLVTYTLAYANSGLLPAAGVVISDPLPAELLDLQVASSGPDLTMLPGARLAWSIDELLPGAAGRIIITGRLQDSFQGLLENRAVITSTAPEPWTGDNQAGPVYTGVGLPDLYLHKSGPEAALSGSQLVYRLEYGNLGTSAAGGVTIADAWPDVLGTPQVTFSGPPLVPLSPGPAAWQIVDLLPGARGWITLTGSVPSDFAGVITNTALISASLFEADRSDNAAGPLYTTAGLPDLSARLDAPAVVGAEEVITLTMAISNHGQLPASAVTITATLPSGLLEPTVTLEGAAETADERLPQVWELPLLPAGESGQITISARLAPGTAGLQLSRVAVSARTPEWSLEDNQAESRTWVLPEPKLPVPRVWLPLNLH